MSAQTIFDVLKAAIAHAVDTENNLFFTDEAERLGLTGGRYDRGISIAYKYQIAIAENEEIEAHYRSYFLSSGGPASNDINKFELFWRRDGKIVAEHRAEYED